MKVSAKEILLKRGGLYDNYKTPSQTHCLDFLMQIKRALNPKEWYEMPGSSYFANGIKAIFLNVDDKTEYRVTIEPITPPHTPVNH